jgi:hypothetical protein
MASLVAAPALLLGAASGAVAQTGGPYNLTWSSIDCGGMTAGSAGGGLVVAGTVGQPDAGIESAGPFVLHGGFWSVLSPDPCYANCDSSTIPPLLNVNDFVCFQTRFASGDPWANCDGSTTPPVLNVNDFVCFQTKFAAGCP